MTRWFGFFAKSEENGRDKVLGRRAVSFAVYTELLGEHRGKRLVKGYQILGVFPAFEFVLGAQMSGEVNGRLVITHRLEKRDICPAV
jgi:hypothetical protein